MVDVAADKDYRQANYDYWQSEYETRYPDTNLVKLYHHVLKREMPAGKNRRALDYGCSNGTNAFFRMDMGFDAYGVDINKVAVEKATKKAASMGLDGRFATLSTGISAKDDFFGGNFDLILSWHTLYYLDNSDLNVRLQSFFNQLKSGGFFVATFVGTKTATFQKTQMFSDGLRRMPVNERIKELHSKEHFSNFVDSADELKQKFALFQPLHMGYIDECFSMSGGENLFHYIFVGRRP